MRYFCNPDQNLAFKEISYECFNLEEGKLCYKNGVLVPNLNFTPYPTFTIDNVKTFIKTNVGFIFMPYKIINNFINLFSSSLINLNDEFEQKTNRDPFENYIALETGTDHFTILKTKYNNININNLSKRKIYFNEFYENITNIISEIHKFTWIIYSIDQFTEDLSKYNYRSIPISCQLISIFYDPDKLINLKNGSLQISNLTFKHFNICKNLLHVCHYGQINDEFINKYSNSTDVILINFINNFKNEINKPEYLPGWEYIKISTNIMLCPIRRGAFEIIKHLGNKLIYENFIMIPIFNIYQPIYDVEYSEIIIDNSSVQKNNKICINCDTPLYDDIYIIFNDPLSNIGKSYCPTCLHCKFDPETHLMSYNGDFLFKIGIDIIARVKYPISVKQVIDQIDIDEIIKDILIQSFKPIYIDSNDDMFYQALYFNFDNKSNKIINNNQKRYLGWNYKIDQFISYAYNKNENTLNYIKSCYIFYYEYIYYK